MRDVSRVTAATEAALYFMTLAFAALYVALAALLTLRVIEAWWMRDRARACLYAALTLLVIVFGLVGIGILCGV